MRFGAVLEDICHGRIAAMIGDTKSDSVMTIVGMLQRWAWAVYSYADSTTVVLETNMWTIHLIAVALLLAGPLMVLAQSQTTRPATREFNSDTGQPATQTAAARTPVGR